MTKGLAIAAMAASMLAFGAPVWAQKTSDLDVALGLADMLRAARTVIGSNQDRINDPSLGDKGLSGEAVLKTAIESFRTTKGFDPTKVGEDTKFGRLLKAQMQAIREVMDENQTSINKKGVGFKGFVPAVFGRLTTERFRDLMGEEADIKVTAPPELIRNRKARPDDWERDIIKNRFQASDWERGKVYEAKAKTRGRDAYRVLVPEYYGTGCLSCHGEPAGELDVTGYPKEGGKEGDLGGVISVTLFK